MLRTTLSGLLLAVVTLAACNKADQPSVQDPPAICPVLPGSGIAPGGCIPPDSACNGAVCTADFRMITVRVADGTGNPLTLDSFVVVDASGAPLPLVNGVKPYGYTGTPGSYAILTDAWVRTHHNQSIQVTAKGFLGTQSFSKPALITTDCCHVSGPNDITAVLAAN